MTNDIPVINGLLEQRFGQPWYIFFREFRDATGFTRAQSADALAVGIYASRGQSLIGFEIKTSRSDWLREHKTPAKAESLFQFCDHWYLVVNDPDIVKDSELPEPWGLIVVNPARRSKVAIGKTAPKLQPVPMTPMFRSALIKRIYDHAQAPLYKQKEEMRREIYEDAFEAGKKFAGIRLKELEKLENEVIAFTAASGIRLTHYQDGEELGKLVKLAQSQDYRDSLKKKLQREIADYERALAHLREDLKAVES